MAEIRRKFDILGMAEEGYCECCGARCPKRRVAVAPIDADGNRGEVERWGVICASKIRGSSQTVIVNAANNADYVAKLEAADRERRFNHRVAGVVPGVVGEYGCTEQNQANMRYRKTGRSLIGSYFLADADGRIVRVDGKDPADVELFRSRGFVVQLSEPVVE
jgi:hypothetical protein